MVRKLLGNIKGEKGEVTSEQLKGEVETLNTLIKQYGINVKMFGAKGDGSTDDTESIQSSIDYANTNGIRKVVVPPGDYIISSSLYLNGCSMFGLSSNVYGGTENGVVFNCLTKDFSCILQGSTSSKNIEFSVENISVHNALVGFEITYVINSVFSNIHAIGCDTGYILGKPSSVGSMFCVFNNLYTSGCRLGIVVDSNEYFNNNVFNNGYIQGSERAMLLKVSGGYGAVNNTFNNVEFKSATGRGIHLERVRETEFNKCYFETGGASITTATNQIHSFNVSNCIFGLFKKENDFGDTSLIIKDDLGGRVLISGGIVFTTNELNDCFLYSGGSVNPYREPHELSPPNRTGSVNNFNFYSGTVKQVFI